MVSSFCSSAHADEEDADEQIPPTLEQCHRMQQVELLRHLEELSRCEGGLTLVLDDGTELRASRIVLMASCEYFRRRLSSSWDGGTTRLELQGVTAPVVESVLRFLSSGSVAGLTAANAQDVLAYADFLGVAPLCGACRRLLAPDAVRTRPSLADFRTLVASHTAFTPPPPQQQAAFASITRNADLSPAGFTLVLQMARGTRLVLPFAERRSNTPELWGAGAPPPLADDPQQWPRHGEFRWLVPEGAQHEVEVVHAAVWKQADNSFCVFRDFARDGQSRGAQERRFSDVTWPVTAAAAPLLKLRTMVDEMQDEDEHNAGEGDDEDDDGELEVAFPLIFRVYRWPERGPPEPPPALTLEMDTQLTGGQLGQLLSGRKLLEWDQAPEPTC